MEERSLWAETFALWREDKASQGRRPTSWWNLLILWPFLAMLLWGVHDSRKDFDIAKRQTATVANVSSHDPHNHDRYGYLFNLNGSQYTGWAYPHDKVDYSLGQRIVVYYDPIEPTRNLAESFATAGYRDLIFAPFCLMIIAGLPLFIFFQRRASSRAADTTALISGHYRK